MRLGDNRTTSPCERDPITAAGDADHAGRSPRRAIWHHSMRRGIYPWGWSRRPEARDKIGAVSRRIESSRRVVALKVKTGGRRENKGANLLDGRSHRIHARNNSAAQFQQRSRAPACTEQRKQTKRCPGPKGELAVAPATRRRRVSAPVRVPGVRPDGEAVLVGQRLCASGLSDVAQSGAGGRRDPRRHGHANAAVASRLVPADMFRRESSQR
jgi:hypothetical protein